MINMKTTHNAYRYQKYTVSRRLFPLWCLGMGCLFITVVTAQNSAPSAGVLPNGSFELEKPAGGGKLNPEGWGFYGMTNTCAGVYVVDGVQQVHSGSRAVSISEGTAVKSYGIWLSDLFEVKPGTAYSIEGWIKTEQCTGQGAWLWVIGYEEKGEKEQGFGTSARPPLFFSGTQDWREWSMEIYIAKNIHWLRIACRLDGLGAAWFDDIKVSKVE